MAQSMRDSGFRTRPTDKASWCMQMAMSTKVSGSTIRQKVTAPTHTLTELTTRESGSMISSMVTVLSLGPMVPGTRAATKTVKRRDMEDLPSQMGVITRDHSGRTRSADLETTTGQMASLMPEIGRRTKWRAKES